MTTEDYEELEAAAITAKKWSLVSWVASSIAVGTFIGALIFQHPNLSMDSIAASLIAIWAEIRTHN